MLKSNQPCSKRAISPPTPHCKCQEQIIFLQQQINLISRKIAIIVKCIQIPLHPKTKDINNECQSKSQPIISSQILGIEDGQIKTQCYQMQQNQKQLQKISQNQQILNSNLYRQTLQQSFLLDGINQSLNISFRPTNPYENDTINIGSFLGKELNIIYDKMSKIEQKIELINKVKTNISILAKIMQKMDKKFEGFQNILTCLQMQDVKDVKQTKIKRQQGKGDIRINSDANTSKNTNTSTNTNSFNLSHKQHTHQPNKNTNVLQKSGSKNIHDFSGQSPKAGNFPYRKQTLRKQIQNILKI